jgi:hypothetical protein
MMTINLDGPTARMLEKYTPSHPPPPDRQPMELPPRPTPPPNKA